MAVWGARSLLTASHGSAQPLSAAAAARRPSSRATLLSAYTAAAVPRRLSAVPARARVPAAPGQRGAASAAPASRRSLFSYSVAASFIGKGRPYDPATHVFHFDPRSRAQSRSNSKSDGYFSSKSRRAARLDSGQDAFFVSRVGGMTGSVALGIADGVGGWMESGVDPADFSHGLCESMAVAAATAATAETAATSASVPLPPRRLMQLGYEAVRRDRSVLAGGSTAVVGVLAPDGMLEVANLGDSGFIQLRRNAVHAASVPQTHAFNTPFQLSVIPPSLLARMAAFGGAQLSDEPRDAEVTRHALRHGDVLVFASDGVWDNLFNQEILRIVSSAMTATGAWHAADDSAGVQVAAPAALRQLTHPPAGAQDATAVVTLQSLIATHITAAARAASLDAKRDGPFAKEVKRYYPQERWHGGKVDDICVVVAVVSEEPVAEDEATAAPAIESRR